MKIVLKMEMQNDDGHVLADTSGEITNIERRNIISDIAIIKQWVGEAYCTLRAAVLKDTK